MSDKNKKDSDKVVDEVLEKYDKKDSSIPLYISSRSFYSRDSLIPGSSARKLVTVVDSVSYPDSLTEQIHSASIAEQIRAGQGNAISTEIEKDAYDFPDGRDDGSLGLGLYDLSEPADVYEREQRFKSDLSSSLREQLRAKRAKESGAVSPGDSVQKNGESDDSERSVSKNSPDVK